MTNVPSQSKKPVKGLPLIIHKVDTFQQRHAVVGFPFAVIKKFGDDNGGYHAALLTYYGFLSLFPLLLVMVTVLQMWFRNDAALRERIVSGVNDYLPIVGAQLQQNIHSARGAGAGLIIGILIAIYGARGGADVLRFALNNIWQVPKNRRAGFPKALLQSLTIMASVAVGFAVIVGVSSFTSLLGHAVWVKIIANVLGFLALACTLLFVFYRATTRRVPLKDMLPGAIIAALLIQILVTFGGLLVAHQLKGQSSVYGVFAVVIGLFFWLYLIAQVLIYAVEIDSVRHLQLWPRAIQPDKPTDADHRAYTLYANVESYTPQEKIDVRFRH
jgi:YihY family inner membrane protein